MITGTTTAQNPPQTRLARRVAMAIAAFLAVIAIAIVGLRDFAPDGPAETPAVSRSEDYAMRHVAEWSDGGVSRNGYSVDYALRHVDQWD